MKSIAKRHHLRHKGCRNAIFALTKAVQYVHKVFHFWAHVKALSGPWKRRTHSAALLLLPVFGLFWLQYPSLNSVFNGHGCMDRKLQHLPGPEQKIPSRSAVEDFTAELDADRLNRMLTEIGRTARKSKVWQRNSMDGLVVVVIDGVELFCSSKKTLPSAPHRKHRNGTEDDYGKSIVAMTVGGRQKVVLGQTMLHAGDGESKDERELTGAHRLLDELHNAYGWFGDILVMDALYLNAPLFQHVGRLHMQAVVRLKDKRRLLHKDYQPLFDQGMYKTNGFETDDFVREAWDCQEAQMQDYEKKVRLLRFLEHPKRPTIDVLSSREMWGVTMLNHLTY